MKIKLITTTTTIADAQTMLIESSTSTESFVVEPSEGKVLRNKKTGEITRSRVCLYNKNKAENYEEIDDVVVLKDSKTII